MKKIALIAIFIVALNGYVFSQSAGLFQGIYASGDTAIPKKGLSIELPEISSRSLIAMATEAYPVTPGDSYTLTYLSANQPEKMVLIVEGDGSINGGFLGKFNSNGLRFRELKAQIERKILEYYPQSSPSLIITSTGLFPITITGEVTQSDIITIWGLTRLSEVVAALSTRYSSFRDIVVQNAKGKNEVFDLFPAIRDGDFSQNPYLKPLDIIIVNKAERLVKVTGEVRRPGTYGLLTGEGLKELIGIYGDGALASAQTDRVVMTRKASEAKPGSESLVVDLGGSVLPDLYDGDEVRLPSRKSICRWCMWKGR